MPQVPQPPSATPAPGPAADLFRAAGRRWRELDPLLPAPVTAAGCGTDLTDGTGGTGAAAAACLHRVVPEGSLELAWGARHRFELTAGTAGLAARPLDAVLARWRDHLAGQPDAALADSSAVVTWPSRDVDGYEPLYRHGLTPLAVIAARTSGRPAGRPGTAPAPAGVSIRRAGPDDIDAVTGLGLEEIRYDAMLGCVVNRPGNAAALRREAADWLAEPEPWLWLALRAGQPVGMLHAVRPADAGWIAGMTGLAPAAYLEQLAVAPGERGHGVGAAMVGVAHAEMAAAGTAVTLLHYGPLNPLSVPFWSQQGYRPLWTVFEARPARSVR